MNHLQKSRVFNIILLGLLFFILRVDVLASTIYGVSYSNSSNTLYSIDAQTGTATSLKSFDFGSNGENSWIGDTTIVGSKLYSVSDKGVLYEFDLANSGAIETHDLNISVQSIASNGSTLYAMAYDSVNKLYQINPSSGGLTLLKSFSFDTSSWIGKTAIIQSNSKLYSASSGGKLYEFNLSSGEITGEHQMSVVMHTIFSSSDALYGVVFNATSTTAKLYTINPNDGTTTLLNTLSIATSKHWINSIRVDETENSIYISSLPDNVLYHYNLSNGSFVKSVTLTNITGNLQAIDYYNYVVPINHAPTNIILSNNTIAEDQVSGSTVGIVSAIDIDAADSHIFTLACAGADNGEFLIDGTSLKTATALDYNTKSTYNICITANDGLLDYNKSLTIDVLKVNNAPTSSHVNLTINEDENKTFASSDFAFTDADSNDTLNSIVITTIPEAGSLQLNGVDITLNQTILASNISQLKFIPSLNASATPYAIFGFKVNDGTENSLEYRATINVSPVDDKPVLTALSDVAKEINFTTFSVLAMATDIENDAITYSATSSNSAVATVSVVNNYIQISSQSYATGSTTITVVATANGLSDTQSFTLSVTEPSAISDVIAPSFTASLSPTTIAPGAISTLTFTIDNSSGDSTFEDVGFLTLLPAGITIKGDSVTTTCSNAVISATDGGSSVMMQEARIGKGNSCTVTLDVTGTTGGAHLITSGALVTDHGSAGTSNATLTIDTTLPKFEKSFSPATINVDDITRLTYTIDNSLNSNFISKLAFTDVLPTGLRVAQVSNAVTTCSNATITAEALSGTIKVSGFYVLKNSTCTISVDIVANAPGTYSSESGELTQNGSTLSAKAIATLSVVQPVVSHTFLKKTVAPGDNTILRFTLNNTDRDNALTNISFSEDLNAALSGLSATALPAEGFCGSGSTISGTSNLTISNASIATESSCTFDVNVSIPSSAAVGDYNVTTSEIAATMDENSITMTAASTILKVKNLPQLIREFIENPASPGDDVTLRYTLINRDNVNSVTDISFKDLINSDIALVTKTSPAADSCGAGSSFSEENSGGPLSTKITNASLAADANCTFDFVLSVPNDASGGSYDIGTSSISGTILGEKLYNTTEPATLELIAAPKLTLSILEDSIVQGDSVTLQFHLQHSIDASTDATDINFTTDLDSVLTGLIATSNSLSDICGVGSTLSGTSILTFSGGSLAPGSECDFNVTAQVPSDASAGTITVATTTSTATVASMSVNAPSASDTLLISGLTLRHTFMPQPLFPGESSTIRYTLVNSASSPAAMDIAFTHKLTNVMSSMQATSLPSNGFCGAGATISGTTTLIVSGMELQAGTSCTFDVPVSVPAGATIGNYVSVTSAVTATVNGVNTSNSASNDYFEIPEYFSIVSDFNESTAKSEDNVTMNITLTNNHSTNNLTNISFSSDLNASLNDLIANKVISNSCNGNMSLGSTVALTNGVLEANSSCTIELSLKIPSSLSENSTLYNSALNVTGEISGSSITKSSVAHTDSIALYANNAILTKSYLNLGAVGRAVVVNYKIENTGDTTIDGISFSDDLNSTIDGLIATGLPLSQVCGDDSLVSGTSIVNLSNASLSAHSSCDFNVSLSIPSSSNQGLYTDNTTALYTNGSTLSAAVATELQVGNIGDFEKLFSPSTISSSEVSTLTYTIDNSENNYDATSLSFTDVLPNGLVIAAVPNITQTCTGGVLTATAGSNTITYSGGSVLAKSTCRLSVDVRSTAVGDYVSASGTLNSSFGENTTADANLSVDNLSKLVTVQNQTIAEDSSDLNITYNRDYQVDDGISYNVKVSDPSIVNVHVVLGQIVITPLANANGTVTIDLNATANFKSALQSFNVTLTPINDAPTIDTTFADMLMQEDAGVTNYELNVSDIDSTDLNITVDSNDTSILRVTPNWINSLNQAAWSQTLDFNLTTVDNANGMVRVTIIANDGELNATRSFDVNVTAVNDAPTAGDLNITIDEDTSKTFSSSNFNFSDVDSGDKVDFIYITSLANKGALTLNNVDVTLNQKIETAAIAQLKFTPAANENGSPYDSFGFRVNDGDVNSTAVYTATINVNAVDDAPTLEPISLNTLSEDFSDVNITLVGVDAEGDPITYTVSSSDPSKITVSIVDGKIVVTPVANANGVVNIEVNATANGQIATQNFDITVTAVNDIPTIATISDIAKDEDFSTFNVTITPNDLDGDNLKLSVDMNDTSIISIPTNSTDWIPSANYSGGLSLPISARANRVGVTKLSVTVEDPSGEKYTQQFLITVNPTDDAPVASSMAATVGPNSQNTFDTFTPTFSDVDGDNPIMLKIETLPTVGTFEEFNSSGDGKWSEVTNIPFEVPMSDLANYRFHAGDNSGQAANVEWSIMTSYDNTYAHGLWSNTATGIITIIDSANNLAPDVNITLNGSDINATIVTINEDSKTDPIYITFSDDYTPTAFLVDVIDSNDSTKVALNDGDFNITRISDNNVSVIITPKANVYGDVAITLGAFDGDKNGTKSFTLHINSLNDIPHALNFEKTINEDNNYSFSSLNPSDVYSDANDSSQDANEVNPNIFQIVTLPAHGMLHLGDSVALGADTNVSINNLTSLVYTPAHNNNTDVSFTWRAFDGEAWTDIKTATIHITAVDDAPILDALTGQFLSEDFSDFNVTLNATDAEGDTITYTIGSSNTNIATVTIVDGKLVITPVANASGIVNFEINATANGQSAIQTFDMNVTAVDDAPYFTSQIPTQVKDEDFGAYSLLLSGSAADIESDAFTYRAKSNNTDLVHVVVSGNSGITITPVANAHGTTTVDVNVTQDNNSSLFDTYSFSITLNPVNDAPTIDTTFADVVIAEDNGTTNYELNVSDLEGDDINVTVDSNNTAILTVTPNFTNWINQATWSDTANPLDFNLTTVANANGMVRVTITTNDGELNSSRSFDVNVTAVNDAPLLTQPNSVVKPEDFTDFNVTLSAIDVDNTNLIYSAVSQDINKATLSLSGNTLRISSLANANGVVTIDVNVSDGEYTDSKSFDINITAVDDAPTLEAISLDTLSEDFSEITIPLNATDVEGDPITYTVSSSDPTKVIVSIVDGNLIITAVANANGTVNIELNATANGQTVTQSFDVTVINVDDAPSLEAIADTTTVEDSSITIDLNARDADGNPITYTVSSSDSSKVTLSIVNGQLVVTPVANANGTVTVQVNATANGQTATQTFALEILSVNDAPTIDTNFSDIFIAEDNGTSNYQLDLSDVEGDLLKVAVSSSDETIVQVSKNFAEELTQGEYSQTLDFNLATVANASGIVTITIRVTDENDATTTKSFNLHVEAVNDAPTLAAINQIIVYKDFVDKNITLNASDVDSLFLTYSAVVDDASLIGSINFSDNIMTINSLDGVTGNTNIRVTVSDGEANSSKLFNFSILPFEDGDDVERVGVIDVVEDENGTTTTIEIDANLTLQTVSSNSGASYIVTVANAIIEAISELTNSLSGFTSTGAYISYSDENVSLEVNATITGTTAYEMSVGGVVTQLLSEFVGTSSQVRRDSNGTIEIVTSAAIDANSSVSAIARADGTAEHIVTLLNGLRSIVTSVIAGAQTTISQSGAVQTEVAGSSSTNGYTIQAVGTTQTDGRTTTKFIRVNDANASDIRLLSFTLQEGSAYVAGSEVEISSINGVLYIKVQTFIDDALVIE